MEVKEDLYYSRNHEWVKTDDDRAYIGITDEAQDQLGDIVFVELPQKGDRFNQSEEIGVVESVKAVSEVYTPVSGTVVDINEELLDSPELLNDQPYESWIISLELTDDSELDNLLSAAEYKSYCEGAQ